MDIKEANRRLAKISDLVDPENDDFIENEVSDFDVCDDYDESLYIAFCGPLHLTDAGREEFKDALDIEIEFVRDITAIIKVDNDDEKLTKKKLAKAKHFFYSAAGYCDADDYDKWFVMV